MVIEYYLILCFLWRFVVSGVRREMFWRERERERESKDQNGGPPVGQVRVLVVGDSGNSMLLAFMV